MERLAGVPVTDDMVQAWADEAERGYDVDVLRKRGRKPKDEDPAHIMPVRSDERLIGALDALAEHDQTIPASRAQGINTPERAGSGRQLRHLG